MSKKEIPDFTQNRELSWLRFNQRVLEEARDESVPLMERMKFVAIFTSNLDEFFMIRVGSLYDLAATDDKKIDQRSGMTAKQQLDAIYRAVSPLYKERDKTYAEIKKQLHPYGVCGLDFKELEQQEKKFVKKYFKEEVLPVLSPQIVDANHPFPHLLSKEIYVVANLKQGDKAMLELFLFLSIFPIFCIFQDMISVISEWKRSFWNLQNWYLTSIRFQIRIISV